MHNLFYIYTHMHYNVVLVCVHIHIHIERESINNSSDDLVYLTVLTTFEQVVGFKECCVRCSITISVVTYYIYPGHTLLHLLFSSSVYILTLFYECN